MATFRVDSTAVGGGDGTTWADAFTTLSACLADAGTVAGSVVWIDDGHDDALAAATGFASKGTFISPINIYSVDKADDSYSAGAIVGSSGAAAPGRDVQFSGFAIAYGVTFKSGDDFLSASVSGWTFHNSTLHVHGATTGNQLRLNNLGVVWELFNSNVIFTHSGQNIELRSGSVFEWQGGTLTFDVLNLVGIHNVEGGRVIIRGVDLSDLDSAGNCTGIFDGFGGSSDEAGFEGKIIGCKMNANIPSLIEDTLPSVDGVDLLMEGVDSANVPYFQHHTSFGDATLESTTVRTAEYDGSTKHSVKMISNARASYDRPMRFKLAEVWCAANPEITVECTHDAQGSEAGGKFGDDEFWIEIEYPTLNNAAYRQWDRTSKMAVLGSSAIRTAGTSGDWTSGKTDFDKVVEQIAGGHAGIHTVWACLGVASKTVYVCPKVDVA